MAEDRAADALSARSAQDSAEHVGNLETGVLAERVVEHVRALLRARVLRQMTDDERYRMFDRRARLGRIDTQPRGDRRDLRIVQVRKNRIDQTAHARSPRASPRSIRWAGWRDIRRLVMLTRSFQICC